MAGNRSEEQSSSPREGWSRETTTKLREITATFRVRSAAEMGRATQIELEPDHEGNDAWAAGTPNGSIRLMVKNDLARELLIPGRSFTVTFSPEG